MNRMSGLRGRVFGLVVMSILVATIGLLIGGYGLPVGLGALGGLVLGFGVGLAFFSTWQGRGQITFGGSQSHRFGSENGSREEERRSEIHGLTEILPIDLGRVRAVVPALAMAVANGLSVEMIAAELCEAGLGVNLDVHVAPGLPHPASLARVSITDNLGTAYRASCQAQGWQPSRLRLVVKAIPAVPPGATALDVRIEEFVDPFPGMGEAVKGPWVFSVSLPSA